MIGEKSLCSGIDFNPHIVMNMFLAQSSLCYAMAFCCYLYLLARMANVDNHNLKK